MSSTRQNPAKQAKALASQLKCPMGDTGQELAHSLNLGNLPMIVSALNALGIEEDDRILKAGPGNGGLLNHTFFESATTATAHINHVRTCKNKIGRAHV